MLRVLAILALASSAAHAETGRWNSGGPVLEGEVIGMGAGAALGFVTGLGVAHASEDDDGEVLLGGIVGCSIGMIVGIPVGGFVGGVLDDGTGRWYGVAIGAVVGDGIALGMIAIGSKERELQKVAAVIGVTAVFLGPWIGYELTSDSQTTATRSVPLFTGSF